MVGVAFICCTFVAKIKCHDTNKSHFKFLYDIKLEHVYVTDF